MELDITVVFETPMQSSTTRKVPYLDKTGLYHCIEQQHVLGEGTYMLQYITHRGAILTVPEEDLETSEQ